MGVLGSPGAIVKCREREFRKDKILSASCLRDCARSSQRYVVGNVFANVVVDSSLLIDAAGCPY